MQLVQLFIQRDAAHDTLEELGQLGLLQFRDVRCFFGRVFFPLISTSLMKT